MSRCSEPYKHSVDTSRFVLEEVELASTQGTHGRKSSCRDGVFPERHLQGRGHCWVSAGDVPYRSGSPVDSDLRDTSGLFLGGRERDYFLT